MEKYSEEVVEVVVVAGHLEDPNTVGPLTQLANCDDDDDAADKPPR